MTGIFEPDVRSLPQLKDVNINNVVDKQLLIYESLSNLWINKTGTGVQVLTTAQRDALTPYTGQVIYNTTDNALQVYNGGWTNV